MDYSEEQCSLADNVILKELKSYVRANLDSILQIGIIELNI